MTSVQQTATDAILSVDAIAQTATAAQEAAEEAKQEAQDAQTAASEARSAASDAQSAVADKVDKVAGKGLSTNDYTNDDKTAVETTIPQALALRVALASTQDSLLVPTSKTPVSATASGTAGMWCWDANYLYVCTDTNAWKRVALVTW